MINNTEAEAASPKCKKSEFFRYPKRLRQGSASLWRVLLIRKTSWQKWASVDVKPNGKFKKMPVIAGEQSWELSFINRIIERQMKTHRKYWKFLSWLSAPSSPLQELSTPQWKKREFGNVADPGPTWLSHPLDNQQGQDTLARKKKKKLMRFLLAKC